jgi:hypothetical protein
MVLQSQLFRNDPKLEAAAVSDPAHIVPGASGGHVGKIQLALILVDRAVIAADAIYGPATAAAVTAYKQKRQILNAQNKVDNIVGKKTIDRLDKEMRLVEQLNTGRTPRCTFRPTTQQSTRASFAVTGGPGALTGFTLLAEKDASLPLAKSWVASTLSKIDLVQLKLSSLTVASPADIGFFASIETHFKVNIPGVSKSVGAARRHQLPRSVRHHRRRLPQFQRQHARRSADSRGRPLRRCLLLARRFRTTGTRWLAPRPHGQVRRCGQPQQAQLRATGFQPSHAERLLVRAVRHAQRPRHRQAPTVTSG